MAGFFADRSVFLTGGTGFIGTELTRALLDRGAEVTVLTRKAARAEHLAQEGASVLEGDVTDPDTFEITAADTVVHGAAWVAYGIPSSKRELFRSTNVDGTKHVLEAAKDADVERFCHLSSVAAIGPTPAGLYPEERAVKARYPEFLSLYEETKHEAHAHVLENHGSMRTTLPMPGVVLGLGSDTEGLLSRYLDGLPFGVRGDNPHALVHVQDVVDGVLLAIEYGEGPYNLVDRNLTLAELFHVLEQASGVPAPERHLPLWTLKLAAAAVQTPYHLLGKVPPLARDLVRSLEVPYTYSAQRAHDDLGWRPDLEGRLESDFDTLRAQRG